MLVSLYSLAKISNANLAQANGRKNPVEVLRRESQPWHLKLAILYSLLIIIFVILQSLEENNWHERRAIEFKLASVLYAGFTLTLYKYLENIFRSIL